MNSAIKRAKSEKFSDDEIKVIINFYKTNVNILNSKFTSDVTLNRKKTLYNKLTDSVNAVSMTTRTTQHIKDKWQNMQRVVKKKVSDYNQKQRSERSATGTCFV